MRGDARKRTADPTAASSIDAALLVLVPLSAVLLTIFGPAMRRYDDNQIAAGVNDLDDKED